MHFLFPNAFPVTVATSASINKYMAKSSAFLIWYSPADFPKKDEISGKFENYSIKIDKKNISKTLLSRIKNNYNRLFEKAFKDLQEDNVEQNYGLYAFVYGKIDENNEKAIAHYELKPDKKTILVLGGSLGAKKINELIEENIVFFKESFDCKPNIAFPKVRFKTIVDRKNQSKI